MTAARIVVEPINLAHFVEWGVEGGALIPYAVLFNRGPVHGYAGRDADGALIWLGGVGALRDGTGWGLFARRQLAGTPRALFWVHRWARKAMDAAFAAGVTPIACELDESQQRARAWLEALGFAPCDDGKWRAHVVQFRPGVEELRQPARRRRLEIAQGPVGRVAGP